MKLSMKMKLIRLWDLHKFKLIILPFVVLVIIFQNGFLNLFSSYSNGLIIKSSDPGFIGLFGSILGAIVGGILSLYGTIYSQQTTARGKAAILRKNTIYTPLYNEFVKIKEILNENPYPTYFDFHLGPQTIMPHPQFNAWERIKLDTRFLQTPNYLSVALDEYTESIKNYMGHRGEASTAIRNKLNEILQENFETECTVINIGDVLLGSIMMERDLRGDFSFTFDHSLRPDRKLTQEDIERLKLLIFQGAKELEQVKDLKYIYENMNSRMDELILSLQIVIRLINQKYESKTTLF